MQQFPACGVAGKDQLGAPPRPLQKARERLNDAAMILVGPEVGGIEKEGAGGDKSDFAVDEAAVVGVSRRQRRSHQKDIGATGTGLFNKGAAGVSGEGGGGGGR